MSQSHDGQDHPVEYLSRKLLPRERSYSTVEKECLAIVWAVQKWHPYLFGRRFEIQTDHRPLQWLNKTKGANQRLLRWSLVLQQYIFVTTHRKGSDNSNADGLSRAFSE